MGWSLSSPNSITVHASEASASKLSRSTLSRPYPALIPPCCILQAHSCRCERSELQAERPAASQQLSPDLYFMKYEMKYYVQ